MASLCHEYQVDWLAKKIEKSLSKLISKVAGVDKLLQYLKFSTQMGLKSNIKYDLVRGITDRKDLPFSKIQCRPLFFSQTRLIQIKIALYILEKLLEPCPGANTKILLCKLDTGLLRCLQDQRPHM